MADGEKKTRGLMSEDARVLLAKRKFGEMTKDAKDLALKDLRDAPLAKHDEAADEHEAVASLLHITAKLSAEGLTTLLKLIS